MKITSTKCMHCGFEIGHHNIHEQCLGLVNGATCILGTSYVPGYTVDELYQFSTDLLTKAELKFKSL